MPEQLKNYKEIFKQALVQFAGNVAVSAGNQAVNDISKLLGDKLPSWLLQRALERALQREKGQNPT